MSLLISRSRTFRRARSAASCALRALITSVIDRSAGAGLGGGALYPAGYTGNGLKKKRGRKKKGEGIIGDVLKNVIGMTGLGVKPKTLKDVLKTENPEAKKRGRKNSDKNKLP